MRQVITFFLLFIFICAFGQDSKTSDFTEEINKYDISDLWTLNRIEIENDTLTVGKDDPLGYIGENFQRFHIHFISAIQNPNNKLQYFIYGKTKVKENICTFQGLITVTESRTFDEGDISALKQGYVIGHYEFYEDPDQKGTGILKGSFQTDFYIEDGNIKYDALMFGADGFQNNQFEGIWTSYSTGKSKKCNWGDYRIPNSDKLDVGAGEFSPDYKYVKYGWENFVNARGYYEAKQEEIMKARKKEKEKWWNENNSTTR